MEKIKNAMRIGGLALLVQIAGCGPLSNTQKTEEPAQLLEITQYAGEKIVHQERVDPKEFYFQDWGSVLCYHPREFPFNGGNNGLKPQTTCISGNYTIKPVPMQVEKPE